MPTLKDITRRITSVKKTAKITKAMQMVAASRLRRMQEALQNNRPYAEKMDEVIGSLVLQSGDETHPLMEDRPGPRKLDLMVVSTDRGLCGGLNTNVFRKTKSFLDENRDQYESVNLNLVGRKAREYFKKRDVTVRADQNQVFPGNPQFELIKPMAEELTRAFLEGEVDEVKVIFTRFHSMMTQAPEELTLLPLQPRVQEENVDPEQAGNGSSTDYIYEPSREGLLETLLPRYIQVRLYWIMLEAQTSEFAARMTAMDSATSNAKEMIDRLTLSYNRARQAAITTELMDIVNGAEALK
jgi:F-type H+-transporting ATPase subunit gamma